MPTCTPHWKTCNFADWWKCHDIIFQKISKSNCTRVLNLKSIHTMVVELWPIENAGAGRAIGPFRIFSCIQTSAPTYIAVENILAKSRSKVRPRSHNDIAHLQPRTNVPTKYQLPTPYSFRHDFKVQDHFSKVNGQIKVKLWHCNPPDQCPHQISISYSLWFLKFHPDKILKVSVITARLKSNQVHTMMLHTFLITVPTSFQDLTRTRFERSRSLQ